MQTPSLQGQYLFDFNVAFTWINQLKRIITTIGLSSGVS